MKLSNLSKTLGAFFLGFSMLSLSTQSQAATLDLTLEAEPDIFSSFLDVTYTAGTDQLVVSGYALQLSDLGSTNSIISASDPFSPGSFDLSATIDDSGTLTGGAFTIAGTIASLGYNTGTLLTGALNNFGFGTTTDTLEFTFGVTGGDAASLYSGLGGIILSSSGYPVLSSFSSDWNNTGSGLGRSDTGVSAIPEPSTYALFALGLLTVAGFARRSAKQA